MTRRLCCDRFVALESWLMVGGAIGLAVSQTLAFSTNSAVAQITPDATLPNNSSVKLEGSTFNITGGTQAGRNLFHSFGEFSIPTGGTAFFNNTADIQNIISRVTGKSVSNIDGLIRTSGTANLFLINPNGIIFGPNASLNVYGSFVATTANAIQFGNQGFFSTSGSTSPELLTVNPSALFYNQIASQPITSQARLQVPSGKSLLLVGGDVRLEGGQLLVPGGRVELGGVAGSGTVGLRVNGEYLDLSFPEGVQRTDVSLTNGARVDVTAGGGGSISINARNLDILGESSLAAGIGEGLGTVGSVAGDITLNATGAIAIGQSSIRNEVGDDATGNGGDINIKAGSLLLTDSALLTTTTSGQGNAGSVLVQAEESVFLGTQTDILSRVSDRATGNSGDIIIQAKSLTLTDGSRLIASTFGQGNAGSIFVQVDGSISLVGGSLRVPDWWARATGNLSKGVTSTGIYSTVESEALGNASNIEIQARSLTLTNGAEVQSLTRGEGNAGNIRVNALDFVNLSGFSPPGGFSSGLITATEKEASGQGGDITVTTGALRLSDGAVLNARTRSAGRGGNINVDINTLELTNGGQLLSSTYSSGRAGNITVNATDRVTVSGSDSTFAARLERFHEAYVDNDGPNSGLFARVRGNATANAGKIEVIARSLRLDNQGTITTETTSGEGGDITLNVRDILLLRNNSNITATAGTAQQGGNGGNITINAPSGFIVAVPRENSDITANAYTGSGGRVQINASGIFGTQFREEETPKSDITASSKFGQDGTVEINTPDIDPNTGLINLPAEPVEPKVASGCTAGASQSQSRFVITGRGGLPLNPREAFNSDTVRVDWVTLNSGSDNRDRQTVTTTIPTPAPIVEATGWVINDFGEVFLTANPPTAPSSSWQTPTTCSAPKSAREH